jgi:hypothetical protein
MSESFTLDQLQSWMQSALVRREAIAPLNLAADLVNDSTRLSAEQHLGIYRRSYIARLRECMKNQFSALAYALGEELFQMFADEYLNACPSDSYTLGELGRRFPDFLEATRPQDENESWPAFMIELARFEFALGEIFDRQAPEALEAEEAEKAATASEEVPDEDLRLAPIFYLFLHRYPVCRYYLDVTKKNEPELPFEQESFCAVTRSSYRLGLSELREGQYLFLERMSLGLPVREALEFLVRERGFEKEKLAEVWPEWRKGFLRSGFFTICQNRER